MWDRNESPNNRVVTRHPDSLGPPTWLKAGRHTPPSSSVDTAPVRNRLPGFGRHGITSPARSDASLFGGQAGEADGRPTTAPFRSSAPARTAQGYPQRHSSPITESTSYPPSRKGSLLPGVTIPWMPKPGRRCCTGAVATLACPYNAGAWRPDSGQVGGPRLSG